MTNRSGHSESFTNEQIDKLQQSVFPDVIDIAIDLFMLHWPEEGKAEIRSALYDNINSAEREYSTSTELLPKDFKMLSDQSLLAKLSRNVAKRMDEEYNPEVLMQATLIAYEELLKSHLGPLVAAMPRTSNTPRRPTIFGMKTLKFWSQVNADRKTLRNLRASIHKSEAQFRSDMQDLYAKTDLGYEKAVAAYFAGDADSDYERHMTRWYEQMKSILSDRSSPQGASKLRATLEHEYNSVTMSDWDKAQIAKLLGIK